MIIYVSMLVVGLITLLVSLFFKSSKEELKERGVLSEGIIYAQVDNKDIIFLNEGLDLNTVLNDQVIVRFVTRKQEWITGNIDQEFQIFYTGQYKNGEKVRVYYDEQNPQKFYVDTKQSLLGGRLILATVGIIFILISTYNIVQLANVSLP